MSGVLEQRYRRLLILLPKHYREARGEEMVGAYMDGVEERRTASRQWPDIREVLSLAALAVSVRTGVGPDGQPRKTAGLARLTALCGAFYLALYGVAQFADTPRFEDHVPLAVRLTHPAKPTGWAGWDFHHPVAMTHEAYGLWLFVYVVLAVGWWRLGGMLALGGIGLSVSTMVSVTEARELPLMVVTAVASFVAARHREPRDWGWLAAAVIPAGLGVYWFFAVPVVGDPIFSPYLGLHALPVESVVGLAVAVCLWNRNSASWLLAVAAAAAQPILDGGLFGAGAAPHTPAVVLIAVFEACLGAVLVLRLIAKRLRSGDDGTMLGGLA